MRMTKRVLIRSSGTMKIGAQINGECVCDTVEIKEFICNMHNHTLTHTHGSELGFLRRV